MNRGGAETRSGNELTEQIIGAAIEVHRCLGPGLLESAYEECLCHELHLRGIRFERQHPLPIRYKGLLLDCGYRVDLLVESLVVVELKVVEALAPIQNDAQLLTYLKLTECSIGLLMNFHVSLLRHGIRRLVNNFAEPPDLSAFPRLGG